MSVRLIFRIEQLGFHWMDFHEIWYWSIFRKSTQTTQAALKSGNNNGRIV
jgi:hypothetical protein